MKRSTLIAPRGVALVITLIMLSVVTIVAVAFLAVARRERASMGIAEDQTDTRYLTEAALARAQADIASKMAASGSRVVFGPFSSTNYVSSIGFNPSLGPVHPYDLYGVNATNVGYTNVNGVVLGNANDDPRAREQYRAMLANLLYDPRPPVFITTNSVTRQQDFRFYLDLNRNGQFDPPVNDVRSLGIVGGSEMFSTNHIPGDPQWLGVLEYPNLPHSASNRFIGRVAYLVLPTGLDFNYIHNRANEASGNSFLRNQGLGSWELNLAALLERVDRGVWSNYNYRAESGGHIGNSFFDAQAVVQYRLNNAQQESAIAFLEPNTFHPDSDALQLPFRKSFLDLYANGPVVRSLALPPPQNNIDNLARPWEGSDRSRYFQNLEDLFSVNPAFSNRLRGAVARLSSNGTNDWTLYRLLSEIGTDSPDGRFYTAYDATKGYYRRSKMNLNFAHGDDGDLQKSTSGEVSPNRAGTFRPWDPVEFFTNAVDRLLESGLHYQGVTFHADRIPVQYFGVTLVTNPPGARQRLSYVTNVIRYGPDIHRLLQMAANLHESAVVRSNLPAAVRNLPTVFRPRFGYLTERFNLDNTTFVLATNLYIFGWAQVTNSSPMAYRWIDPMPENQAQLQRTLATNGIPASRIEYDPSTDVNVHGVPWVVGTRKGFPSFNEAYWQTEIGVTRRVRLDKFPATASYATNSGRPVAGTFTTNVQFLLDVTRRGSVEAWNSYQADYTRPYRLIVSNLFCLAFSNYVNGQYRSLVPDTALNSSSLLRFMVTNLVVSNSWPGTKTWGGSPQSFQVPIDYASNGRGLSNQLVFVPPGALGAATAPSGQLIDLNIPANRRLGFGTRFYNAALSNSTPNLAVAMTNYLIYAMVDQSTDRIIDFVNLKSITYQTNILNLMGVVNTNGTYIGSPPRAANELIRDSHLWMTNIVDRNAPGITAGITNQILASGLRPESVSVDVYRSIDNRVDDKRKAIANFRYFLYRDAVEAEWRAYGDPNIRTNTSMDAMAPTRKFIITDRRAVNDPLVHYTLDDLRPGALWLVGKSGAGSVPGLHTNEMGVSLRQDMLLRQPRSFAPWGVAPIYAGASELSAYEEDFRFKDPGITRSDDWNFPVQELPTVGSMGRVHRGTPWQTVYLKSGVAPLGTDTSVMPSGDATWATWAGYRANETINLGLYRGRPGPLATNLNGTTQPEGDWNLLHLFTTAYNDNAARGLLPSDHRGEGGWAAVLGGVNVVTSTNGVDTFIDPTTPQFRSIVTNLQLALRNAPWGRYTNLGGVLSASALTVDSPYLQGWVDNVTTNSDALVERIPQQVLGLLRQPEPHFVVYAFGQSLKPAPGSLVTAPGPYFGLCQNYQITGEQIIKSVVRFDGPATNLQAIVERQQVLSAP